jgi:predicted  nucleic acid-binding Zn-ribbon protein
MKKIKELISMVPSIVWIILIIIIIINLFWFKNDISNWWEKRKQVQFDKAQVEKQVQIDQLNKERDAERALRLAAEAREQIKAQEVDALRKLIDDRGGKIEEIQKNLTEISKKYQEDLALIEAVKRGEVSKYDLCIKQCKDSAEIGFVCRPTYCNQWK